MKNNTILNSRLKKTVAVFLMGCCLMTTACSEVGYESVPSDEQAMTEDSTDNGDDAGDSSKNNQQVAEIVDGINSAKAAAENGEPETESQVQEEEATGAEELAADVSLEQEKADFITLLEQIPSVTMDTFETIVPERMQCELLEDGRECVIAFRDGEVYYRLLAIVSEDSETAGNFMDVGVGGNVLEQPAVANWSSLYYEVYVDRVRIEGVLWEENRYASLFVNLSYQAAADFGIWEETEAVDVAGIDWATLYLDYIKNDYAGGDEGVLMQLGFYLIDLDSDNIPELYVNTGCEAGGSGLLYIDAAGNVTYCDMPRLGGEYQPGVNQFVHSNGHMGSYYDIIYTMDNRTLKIYKNGYYNDQHATWDEEIKRFVCETNVWDDCTVSIDTYVASYEQECHLEQPIQLYDYLYTKDGEWVSSEEYWEHWEEEGYEAHDLLYSYAELPDLMADYGQ